MFKVKKNSAGSKITLITVLIGIIIGLFTKSFHKIGYLFEDSSQYNSKDILQLDASRFIMPIDLVVYFALAILLFLFVYLQQREKTNILENEKELEIINLDNQVKQIGGTLVYQIGHALDLSLEEIMKNIVGIFNKGFDARISDDFQNLVTVTSHANQSKGDKSPVHWLPPNQKYWAEYAKRWRAVKEKYGLLISKEEEAI